MPLLPRYFNSRPHGGRHVWRCIRHRRNHFNSRPHGGRHPPSSLVMPHIYFNSRPHGGRPSDTETTVTTSLFQLTPSRRATCSLCFSACIDFISTHALTEGDTYSLRPVHHAWYFNSRPHGGRQILYCDTLPSFISTHALTEGDSIQFIAHF